jgi:hypothetical protein
MSNQDEFDFDLIEGYIDGTLNEEQRELFERKRKSNAAFNEQYEFRINIATEWRRSQKYQMINQQLNKIKMEQKKISKPGKTFMYLAAASVIAIVMVTGIKFFNNTEVKNLQFDQSEVKSSVLYHDSRYKQISPVHGQVSNATVLTFEWESAVEIKTNLVILKSDNQSLVYRIAVNSADKKLKFTEHLDKGTYIWKLEGFEGEKIFVVK